MLWLHKKAYWTRTKIKQPNLQNSLKIAAIGIAVVFSSIEINSLLYASLWRSDNNVNATRIILLIYRSICVCKTRITGSEIEKGIFPKRRETIGFPQTIGKIQMEKELEKSLKSILKRSSMLEESRDDYRGEENVRELVQEVIYELRLKETANK